MIELRRGFKAEAERIAACVRRDLDLGEWEPICPWRLARHLDVDVVELGVYLEIHPQDVAILRQYTGPKGFSALTLPFDEGRSPLVILNDGHSLRRRAADLAHELAHALLIHSHELFGVEGRDAVRLMDEAEANWLGPAILVPGKAARHILREGYSVEQAAEIYGVSGRLIEMRLQVTGARKAVRT